MGNGTSFKNEQLAYLEGLNQVVSPNSLYEAQLQLRLNKETGWLKEVLNRK